MDDNESMGFGSTPPPPPERAEEPAEPKADHGDVDRDRALSRAVAKGVVIGVVIGMAVVGLGIGAFVLLTGDGGSGPLAPLAQKYTLTGSLSAPECAGGYDIEGASVEVRDEADKLIGATTTGFDTGTGQCSVDFTIGDLPKADFYQITIGTHGGPSYTFAELEANDWDIALSLD